MGIGKKNAQDFQENLTPEIDFIVGWLFDSAYGCGTYTKIRKLINVIEFLTSLEYFGGR